MAFNAEKNYYSTIIFTQDLTNEKESIHKLTRPDVLSTEESELHKFNAGCVEKQLHQPFIPVNEFNIQHLPQKYRDNEILNYVTELKDLTVLLEVRMTSTERKQFWPGTKKRYPSYGLRGRGDERVGSGIVNKVSINSNECQCRTCKQSGTPSLSWGEIMVVTATHVVYDDDEAQKTTCRFFFDNPDSPMFTLDGFTVVNTNDEKDRSTIKKQTCDVDLLREFTLLQNILRKSEVLRSRLNQRYWNISDEHKLCIIISHPHGCEKKISVGHWVEKFVSGAENTKYTYTTHTCPGSGGAPVVIFSRLDYKGYHTHQSVNKKGQYFSGTFIG